MLIIKLIFIITLIKIIKIKFNFTNLNILGQIDLLDFKLKLNNKKILNQINLKKIIIILFFGYSLCPDICPQLIENLINKLKLFKNFYKLRFLFFSIDCKKENIEIAQKYINKYKTKNLYAINGTLKWIEHWVKLFRVIYSYKYHKKKILHSNLLYIIKLGKIISLNVYRNLYNLTL